MEDFTEEPIESLLKLLTDLVRAYVQQPPDEPHTVDEAFRCAMGRVKQRLIRMRLKQNDDCRYAVRLVQQDIMELTTVVVAKTSGSEILAAQQGIDVFRRSVCSRLYLGLKAFLDYLEYIYKEDFDHDIPLSGGQWSAWSVESHNQLAILSGWCEEKKISKKLIDLVFRPFEEVIAPKEGMPLITHRDRKYHAALLNDLVHLRDEPDAKDEDALLRVLLRHNFNPDTCIRYCMSYLNAAVKGPDATPAEQLEKVYHYSDLISAECPTGDVALRPDSEALHVRLMNWVDTAIARCEKLMSLPQPTKKGTGKPGERAGTTLSIPMLGGWNSLLYDCNFYNDKNLSRICRSIAGAYSTVGSEQPSFHDIYEAFGKPTDAACEFAYDMCHKILHRLEQLGKGRRSKPRRGG
jgi:hypothetical protein